jgi:hypothetical protein
MAKQQSDKCSVVFMLEGTSPLMMHNGHLANPFNPFVQQLQQLSKEKKRKGVDKLDVEMKIAETEFRGGLILDQAGHPCLTADQIRTCIQEGAKLTRGGKTIERGVVLTKREMPLIYDGPKTADGLWADVKYRDQRMVTVGQARILRTRPIFQSWMVEVPIIYIPMVINFPDLLKYTRDAGMLCGLLEGRGKYSFGRFRIKAIDGKAVTDDQVDDMINELRAAA